MIEAPSPPSSTALSPPSRLLRVAAPLSALAYPALVWSGPAVWPPLLILALVVPATGVWASVRLADHDLPAARAVALVAVGAPPLYSLLGGLLDFQRAIAVSSAGAWIPLWITLVAVAALERPRARVRAARTGRRLAILHGLSAAPIAAFALVHVANHLAGLAGGPTHIAVMTALRSVYRHPVVESLLLACVAFQVASGAVLVGRRLFHPARWSAVMQTASGAYLCLFFASHLTAVLRARHIRHTDTSWSWLTSDDLFTDPWSARLAPYYFLAVIAVGVHIACGLRAIAMGHGVRPDRLTRPVGTLGALAVVAAVLILVALGRG